MNTFSSLSPAYLSSPLNPGYVISSKLYKAVVASRNYFSGFLFSPIDSYFIPLHLLHTPFTCARVSTTDKPARPQWFLMNGFAQIFNSLVSYGVYQIPANSIPPWKVFMIITGLLTFIVGILFWCLMPDNPMKARFLTMEERRIAIERLRNDSTGVENKTWKRYQFMEAMKDWKVWTVRLFPFPLCATVKDVTWTEGVTVRVVLVYQQSFQFIKQHDANHHQ